MPVCWTGLPGEPPPCSPPVAGYWNNPGPGRPLVPRRLPCGPNDRIPFMQPRNGGSRDGMFRRLADVSRTQQASTRCTKIPLLT